MPSVSLIVPALNEEAVIGRFLDAALGEVGPDWEIVVVDDGSSDSTAQLVEDHAATDERVRLYRHVQNQGLGAALRTGFGAARGKVLVTIDADLSHPFDVAHILADFCLEGADAAFGSRFVPGGGMEGVPAFRRAVSRVGNIVFRFVFWSSIRDMTTGLRGYRTEVARSTNTSEPGFAIQLELSVQLLAQNRSVVEVPLVLKNRLAGESKMVYRTLLPRYMWAVVRLMGTRWLRRVPPSARD
jgi:dolichol-phosphate mannosyltransferase